MSSMSKFKCHIIHILTLFLILFSAQNLEALTQEALKKVPSVDFCKANASKTDVYFYLFKSASQTEAIVLNDGLILPQEDHKNPLKILIHGYTSNVTSPWYKEMKNEYFKKGPHNIIYVDWGRPANKSYAVSAANIQIVGEHIAEVIKNLRFPLENIHIIGHSLGSHLAGFVGKYIFQKTGNKLKRITATDPAGPGFENVGPESRLSKRDAEFVDVIHSDVDFFGLNKPIGHVDFYPNFGQHQPGCGSRIDNENCSHARSNTYFIESINNASVLAKSAKFEFGNIVPSNKDDQVIFGDSVPLNALGIYHLKTDSIAPFLIRNKRKRRHND